MSSGLADAAARATAIDPTRSVIVQAPAGSGKTGLLTQRFLGLLAGVAEPEEILAITFTRKAAAEMRARVVGALRDAADGVPAASDYEATTRRLAGAALARDRQRGWRLIGQPARLQIMTIDGLCHLIASRAPWSTGLGFQPDLRDDAQPLYAEAARRCLDHLGGRPDWSAPLERALAHLDNDHLRLAGLLEVLLPKRDQWLRAFGNRGGAELVGAIDAALRDIAGERLRELLRRLTPASRGALAELLSLGVTGAAPLAQGWRSGSTLPQFGPDSAGDWRLLFQVLLTGKG
ncbi:MAG: UvrD-helicase domain-containing protein, partial [Pseudomonadota bacterium]|nr:UvrD-helicase domain-containing protein [Pseudomonadota bacterium]